MTAHLGLTALGIVRPACPRTLPLDGDLDLMARRSSFNVHYLARMSALSLLATLAGMIRTGEPPSGFVGTVEIPIRLVGAALLIASAAGATSVPGAS